MSQSLVRLHICAMLGTKDRRVFIVDSVRELLDGCIAAVLRNPDDATVLGDWVALSGLFIGF
jgi:hypothetical protein